jgi:hypothetical protein
MYALPALRILMGIHCILIGILLIFGIRLLFGFLVLDGFYSVIGFNTFGVGNLNI